MHVGLCRITAMIPMWSATGTGMLKPGDVVIVLGTLQNGRRESVMNIYTSSGSRITYAYDIKNFAEKI